MAKIEITETEELPLCPHCGKQLKEVLRNTRGSITQHVAYFCPHCKKLLSIGYNTAG